jgi:hypothetical protein
MSVKSINIESYRQSVNHLAKINSDKVFRNHGSKCAAAVIDTMIDKSYSHIKMFSGSLNEDVLRHCKKFIELLPEKNIQIVLESLPSQDSELYDLLKDLGDNVRIIPTRVMNNIDPQRNRLFHFLVVDKKAYRIEIDRSDYQAECCFNDENMAFSLEALFKQLWEASDKAKF